MNRLMLTRPPARLLANRTRASEISPCTPVLTAALLHERHLEAVFGYVARRVALRQEAEDITAEVFAAAFAGLAGFHGDSPLAWLLGIARRKIADAARRHKHRETLACELAFTEEETHTILERLGASAPSPEQLAQHREARQQIRALVEGLPADQREALLLQYVDERPIADIAIIMGRSSHAVNSLLQRARANIFRAGRAYFLPDFTCDSDVDAPANIKQGMVQP